MITKIGIWEIDEDGLTGKVGSGYDYNIAKERLWETRDFKGQIVWDWLIHLTEKDWVTKENINDLNTAFLFCQDYFKAFKPNLTQNVSTAQTIYIQQQQMDIREQMASFDKDFEDGIEITSPKAQEILQKLNQLEGQIKLLDIEN